jgi:hypothetical protein
MVTNVLMDEIIFQFLNIIVSAAHDSGRTI